SAAEGDAAVRVYVSDLRARRRGAARGRALAAATADRYRAAGAARLDAAGAAPGPRVAARWDLRRASLRSGRRESRAPGACRVEPAACARDRGGDRALRRERTGAGKHPRALSAGSEGVTFRRRDPIGGPLPDSDVFSVVRDVH